MTVFARRSCVSPFQGMTAPARVRVDRATGGGDVEGGSPRAAASSRKGSRTLPLVRVWLAAWPLGWQRWFGGGGEGKGREQEAVLLPKAQASLLF